MLKRKPPLYRAIIRTEPRYKAPITFLCAVLDVDKEIAYKRIKDAWVADKKLAFGVHLSKWFVELQLPRKQMDVCIPFQGEYYSFLETDINRLTTYYLPLSWVSAVISRVPYRENDGNAIRVWFMKQGFILRRLEELV